MIAFLIQWFMAVFSAEVQHIPVMMGIDDNYVRITVVALTSMFENAQTTTFYHVTILTPGNFKHESKLIIGSLEGKYNTCKIDFFGMGERYGDAPRSWSPNAATFYRLDTPSLFPNVKKCLFLDSDIIVRHDLSEMFNVNMDDCYIAGVFEGNTQRHAQEKIRLLGMPDLKQYINTGVSIMNLEKLRLDKMEEKYAKFIKKRGYYIKTKPYLFGEQDVINPVCYGRILHLPLEFGLLINLRQYYSGNFEKKDPAIVHFAAPGKPWEHDSFEATIFHKEFWYYAKKAGLHVFDNIEKQRLKRKNMFRKTVGIKKRRKGK